MNSPTAIVPFGFRRDLHRWRQLVAPAWVAGLVAGAPLVAPPAGDWRLFEVGFGVADAFERGHIPGAGYIDTAQLEHGPMWNKVADAALERLLLGLGIRHDTSVVLYGRNPLAAARAAHLLLYAGVADVRLLDGGFALWCAAGLPCAGGAGRPFTPVQDFGAALPRCPHFMSTLEHARSNTGALVSVRTWSEFSGASSGYSYIAARGDIAGARWGRAGREGDVNSMSEYQHADGRMLPAAAIERMWDGAAIVRGQAAVFYCGTGWRASLAFFYAWLMGWDAISVYDGGWFEWSLDRANPTVIRIADAIAA